MAEQRAKQSNPFSTGGGGNSYEIMVQTYFAMHIIMGEKLSFSKHTKTIKMKLQGHYDGYNTDDCILFGDDGSKCLCQIKHSLTLTENNTVFRDVIRDAWNDYCNRDLFSLQTDRIVLVVSDLSSIDNKDTKTIIEWARYCENEIEFEQKVNTSGFSSAGKVKKLCAIKKLLTQAKGEDINDFEVWDFIRHFYIQVLDLEQIESPLFAAVSNLATIITGQHGIENTLYRYMACYNRNAGTISLEQLVADLEIKRNISYCSIADKIENHNEIILASMRNSTEGVCIDRSDYVEQIHALLENKDIVLIAGERGVGKTGIVKSFLNLYGNDSFNLLFRAEEFSNKASINELFSSINWNFDTSILNQASLGFRNKYIFIESLERILENENTKIFTDLMSFVSKHSGWKIIGSIRNYALHPILINFLIISHLSYDILTVDKFTDKQLNEFCMKSGSKIKDHVNEEIIELLKIPFYLEYILRTIKCGYVLSENETYQSIKNAIWDNVIKKTINRQHGVPLLRSRIFTEIALQRAKQQKYAISSNSYDPEILMELQADELISLSNETVSITHDVLEDWALERWIEQCFNEYSNAQLEQFFLKLGCEQPICRAYRLWLIDKFHDKTFLLDYFKEIMSLINDNNYSIWIDETIVAILYSNQLKTILYTLKDYIFSQPELLNKICFMIRVAAKKPDDSLMNAIASPRITESSSFIQLKPSGACWIEYITFLYENKEDLPEQFWPHCKELLIEWIVGISIRQNTVPGSKEAGLLALYMISMMISDTYSDRDMLMSILKVAITCYSAIPQEFNEFVNNTVFNDDLRNHHGYIKEITDFILTDYSCCHIAKHNPQLLIRIAKKEWLINSNPIDFNPLYETDFFNEQAYGFHHSYEYGYYPPSGYKEPFLSLFTYNPLTAINFVIDLCNMAVNSYLDYYFKEKDVQEKQETILSISCTIQQDNGATINQIAYPDLWCAYRGISTVPSILKCALMALENYLLDYFAQFSDDQEELDSVVNYILSKSNSVLTTAVIAAVIIANKKFTGRSALLLLQNKSFYEMDLERTAHEYIISPGFRPWDKEILFYNERKKSNAYSWRKDSLETLCVRLQFSKLRKDVIRIIDDIDTKFSGETSWQFCKHRIDTRDFIALEGEKENEFILSSKPVEGELKLIQDKQEEKDLWLSRYSKLLQWSSDAIKKKEKTELPLPTAECIEELQLLLKHYDIDSTDRPLEIYLQGINQTIAILLRDYFDDLEKEDKEWCIQYVLESLDKYDRSLLKKDYKHTDIGGVRSLAKALPAIIKVLPNLESLNIFIMMLTSFDYQLRLETSKSISDCVWDINPQFSMKCIDVICEFDLFEKEHYSSHIPLKELKKPDCQKEILWLQKIRKKLIETNKISRSGLSIEAYSLILVMLPTTSHNYSLVKPLFTECINNICMTEQRLIKHDNIDDINLQRFYDVSSYNTDRIGEFFYNLTDSQLTDLKDIINQIGLKAPHTCQWVMIKYRLLCDIDRNYTHYWRFWILLSSAAKQISIELNKGENYRFREERGMLIEYMYVNSLWQPADYENMPVNSGADYICSFAKETIQNPIVYEGLASLMYNFPSAFLKKGIIAQKDISDFDLYENFRRSSNAVFYMENNLFAFITQLDTNTIPAVLYQSCRKILDALIRQSSSKAYYIRDYMLKSKKSI